MDTVWVLVAGSSEAKIYAAAAPGEALKQVAHFEHAGSRKHARDITSDLPGRITGSDGSHHAMEARTDIKQEQAIEFSREIDHYLQAGLNTHQFGKLIIVAAPAFLGQLRAHLDSQVAKSVVYELDKNLLHVDAAELRAHLPGHL
jgi:protein required for attachment to host cells